MSVTYVSVDVETAGPHPAGYPLLALGACSATEPGTGFYVELQPDRTGADPEALRVSGLSLEHLARDGVPAAEGMAAFAAWLERTAAGSRPVMVALNAPFDWLFVADYLYRYVGYNPLGHNALDLKALYMGVARVSWTRTSLRHMAARYGLPDQLPHHALEDARHQAALFRALLAELEAARAPDPPPLGVTAP